MRSGPRMSQGDCLHCPRIQWFSVPGRQITMWGREGKANLRWCPVHTSPPGKSSLGWRDVERVFDVDPMALRLYQKPCTQLNAAPIRGLSAPACEGVEPLNTGHPKTIRGRAGQLNCNERVQT
jgi:hypothetical protein